MLTSIVVLAALVQTNPDGYARFYGDYSGTMKYHDESNEKDLEMPVELSIRKGSPNPIWRWTFRFAPGKSSVEIGTYRAEGTSWFEKETKEELKFELRGWQEFCTKKQDFFEIKRLVEKTNYSGNNVDFRRRYTFRSDGFLSEKWLKRPGKPEYFSHKMDLKRATG